VLFRSINKIIRRYRKIQFMEEKMSDEPHGLLDDDPALDYILYEEMQKDERDDGNRPKGGGCLGLLFLITAPAGALFYGFSLLI